jgi:DnaJ-class molecular chaperone
LKEDFYRILGVNQEADPAKIKKAYRRAAKRFHPDISPKDEERFKKVQSAYETLSDPKKRAVYDEQFLSKPVQNARPYPPPNLTPSSPHLFDEMEELFSDIDDFGDDELNRIFGIYKEDRGDIHVEVILTQAEAAIGCKIPIEIPFFKECKRCHGTGRVKGLICGFCRGNGKEKLKKEIEIKIPSGVKSGMMIRNRIHLNGKGKDLFITLKVQTS